MELTSFNSFSNAMLCFPFVLGSVRHESKHSWISKLRFYLRHHMLYDILSPGSSTCYSIAVESVMSTPTCKPRILQQLSEAEQG